MLYRTSYVQSTGIWSLSYLPLLVIIHQYLSYSLDIYPLVLVCVLLEFITSQNSQRCSLVTCLFYILLKRNSWYDATKFVRFIQFQLLCMSIIAERFHQNITGKTAKPKGRTMSNLTWVQLNICHQNPQTRMCQSKKAQIPLCSAGERGHRTWRHWKHHCSLYPKFLSVWYTKIIGVFLHVMSDVLSKILN